ncbi:uncharacterized protein LOC111614780 [Centruroides sculpturatus]|uniref:uncharacterized protein LOC111614780 n=1 Tax=Centruroides sculpturatus TaxID=218467 RepID=UPI000C6D39FE|nr:uncharacterized protein LOC111614780 [Centruroides sculpturatus]
MNVLYWIKNRECWVMFVMNTVNEIRFLSCPDDWNHVPGYINLADLSSWGCNARILAESHWWETLQFPSLPVEEWPRQKEMPDMEIVSSERKKSVISSLDVEKAERFYENYSTYWKILRITAWIYRFVSNLKGQSARMSGGLTVKEIRYTELVLLKLFQKEEFPKGINNRLQNSMGMTKGTKMISVGDIVLVGHDNQKRLDWPLEKVVVIYPSKDGLVRVAKIKTHVGFLIHPVRRLYPLEIYSGDEKHAMQDEFCGKTADSAENDRERTCDQSRMTSAAAGSDVVKNSSENYRVSKRGRPLTSNQLNL